MQGYLMLTEARSGSSWLGSLANSTRIMGNSSEWLDPNTLGRHLEELTPDEFFELILSRARSENGYFGVKLFPRHLYSAHLLYGFDFIRRCVEEHDTKLIVLRRNDRVLQSISLAKGSVTGQWGSMLDPIRPAEYDFDLICRCYFFP